ncbi:MAG: DUF4304 domain-containing protein [Pseudomonadota bacterium]
MNLSTQALKASQNKSSLAKCLKENGFCRHGDTWNRTRGEVVDVVNFQGKSYQDTGAWDFTVNLGIGFYPVLRLVWQNALAFVIDETDCFPRAGIVNFSKGFDERVLDKWWTADSKSTLEAAAGEIEALLVQGCFPIMNSVVDLQSYDALCSLLTPLNAAEEISKCTASALINGTEPLKAIRGNFEKSPGWSKRVDEIIDELRGC